MNLRIIPTKYVLNMKKMLNLINYMQNVIICGIMNKRRKNMQDISNI